MTDDSFKHLPRKKIRYWLFVKKKGNEETRDLPPFFDDLIAHYETQDNFTNWRAFADDFMTLKGLRSYDAWDIGIDDAVTRLTRPEKAWLCNNTRFEIVKRDGRRDNQTWLEKQTNF